MKERTALVIGAGRGIGKAIAGRLARDGFEIIGTASREAASLAEVKALTEAAGRRFTGLVFDVADRAAAAGALRGKRVDPAGRAAVSYRNEGGTEGDYGVYQQVLPLSNLDGFYNTVQPLLMGMMARKSGRIVAISSASGQTGQGGQVNYSASKAALIGAVKALAREVGRKNILVNAVAPGFIETAMTADLPKEKILPLIPLNRAGQPEEVAGVVSFLCGPDASYLQGQVLAVNGGLVI